jgi:diguanylate cyclase (GGDEF)-like protein
LVIDYRTLPAWILRIVIFVALIWICSNEATADYRAVNSSATSNELRYCIDPDWLPYEGLVDGKHVGISSDYLQSVSLNLGFVIKLVPTQSWSESLDYLQQGKCDFTPLLNITPERAQYLLFSDVYFEAPNVLVSLKSEPFLQGFENIGNRTLAIPRGYRLVEYVQQHFPEINLVLAQSEKDGLEKVVKGEAEVFVGSMYTVNAYIQQKGLKELKISGWGGPPDELRFGVVKSKAGLIPKINYALQQISEQQRMDIYRKWHNVAIVDKADYGAVFRIILVLTGFICLLIYRNHLANKHANELEIHNAELEVLKQDLEIKNQELDFLAQHDPLTLLYNRHYFNRRFIDSKPHSHINEPACIVIIDVDFFKQINDNFGHSIGDNVLTLLAKVLKAVVREGDVVARWGGEEFILVCPNLDMIKAVELCQRIAQELDRTDFSHQIKITCSFGVASLMPEEPMMNCLDRADKALYRAKMAGRNQIYTEKRE